MQCWLHLRRPAATKRRIVHVSDPCSSSGEAWCYSLRRCSVALQCVAVNLRPTGSTGTSNGGSSEVGSSGSNGGTTPNRPLVLAAKDNTPPHISVQGTGATGLNPQGEPVMIDSVLFASDWNDPGVTARDVNELGVTVNLTGRVQVGA